jgi:GDPmannose 4,6-dehydratase
MQNIAFITGITGQDGSYLSEFLLEKNYKVYGMMRKISSINTKRIDHIYNKLNLQYGDLSDILSIIKIFNLIKSENKTIDRLEIYNLAAQSHVKVSFDVSEYTGDIDALGTLRILEAIKLCNLEKIARFYQASTSELYGKVSEIPQNEETPFYPRSPYGVAKLYSYWIVKNFRESYNLHASNGILFNHESPRRGETFVTRKITIGLGKILRGELDHIKLGNIYSKRDWGHAKDYIKGMWMVLQQDQPDDYVLATNHTYSIKDFINKAFSLKNINLSWRNQGLDEEGYEGDKVYIKIDKKYFRPCEVDLLIGDYSKAKRKLGWKPEINFEQLVKEMVDFDCF